MYLILVNNTNTLIESSKMNEFCQKINTVCRKFITTPDEFQESINKKLDKLSEFIEFSTTPQNSQVDNINHNRATDDVPYKPP